MESIKEFPRGITDQAISKPDNLEVVDSVRPGPGQVTQQVVYQVMLTSQSQATSDKRQAASYKQQASSIWWSCKQQALNVFPIVKRQAWRFAMIGQETVDRGALIKFY